MFSVEPGLFFITEHTWKKCVIIFWGSLINESDNYTSEIINLTEIVAVWFRTISYVY